MNDYRIDDVISLPFSTRAFATGVPTALAGTPTVEIYEDAGTTPIVEGAGKLVLTVSLNSVAGFNMATVTLSAANGFESGKHYTLIIKTGTVGGVSVVGEVVAEFTIEFSAAANGVDVISVAGVASNATNLASACSAYSATRGLAGTALPAAAADAAGGLVISDAGGLDIDGRLDTNIGSRMATYTQPTGFLAADFPALVASTTNITGGTITTVTTVSNQVTADVTAISGGTAAADNLEAMYDGTGYTDDTAPASRFQVGNISVGSGGISTVAASATVTTGSETLTFTATANLDNSLHEIAKVGEVIDMYYEFNIGGSGIPQAIEWDGYATSNNDVVEVFMYNWVSLGWDQVGTISGGAATITSKQFTAITAHVGTAGDVGKVRLKFSSDGADVATVIATDRILCTYTFSNTTVGYEGGAVWIDTSGSNTSTESFVDGTADNPVSTIAAARTIADNLNLKVIHALPGSDFLLSADSWDNFAIIGRAFQVNLAGRSVSGTSFQDCIITGDDDGSNAIQTIYTRCKMGANTLGLHRLENCGLSGTVTLAEANATYDWIDCHSRVAGTTTPKIDFGTTVGDTNLNVRNYSGGIEISQMGDTGTDNMSLEGQGQLVINSDCSGGTVAIRGAFTVTDNAAGAVTLSDDARYDVDQIAASVVVGVGTAGLDDLVATQAEPTTAPAASDTLAEKVNYMYAALRNQIDVTATTKTFYSDAGASLWTKGLSDAAGTYTEAEGA